MGDDADKNTFLQQYRDMLRYIMCHRKVISYINCLTFWATVVGFLSSTFLGFEIIMEGVAPEKQKIVYGTLAFTSAVTTALKETPWIQRRFKIHHKLLTEHRSWQSQYYLAARRFYETQDVCHIKDVKIEYDKMEDELITQESNEDLNIGGILANVYSQLKIDEFENQFKLKYRRVTSFVRNDSTEDWETKSTENVLSTVSHV